MSSLSGLFLPFTGVAFTDLEEKIEFIKQTPEKTFLFASENFKHDKKLFYTEPSKKSKGLTFTNPMADYI
jgi:hypothetical protein